MRRSPSRAQVLKPTWNEPAETIEVMLAEIERVTEALAVYRVVLFLVAGASLLLAGYAWQNRELPTAGTLAVLLTFVTIWVGSFALAATVTSAELSVWLVRIMWIGIPWTMFFLLVFALEYTGHGEYVSPRYLAPVALHPIAVMLAVWTNPLHHAFFTPMTPDPGEFVGVAYSAAPGFWVHIAISYAILLAACGVLAHFLVRSEDLYRDQAVALLVAAFSPWIANVVYVAGAMDAVPALVPADTTPLGFAVSGMALTWAVAYAKLTDVAPIATSTVLEGMHDGMIVLDRNDRILEVNPRARTMLGVETGEPIVGRDIRSVLGPYAHVYDAFEDVEETVGEEVTVQTPSGERTYRVTISVLTGRGERPLGRVILLHDVTALSRREAELRETNERLEQFASVVSHDLRNPLTIASGYLELARDDPTPEHFAEVERAHDRMIQMIDDVLALARGADDDLDPEPVELETVARQAWDGVATGEATLTVDTDLTVRADEGQLRRLLENCVRNAIEHAGAAPTVTVRTLADGDGRLENSQEAPTGTETSYRFEEEAALEARMDDRRVNPTGRMAGPDLEETVGFAIDDDGPGIPPEERTTVLDAGVSGGGGTGLGLAIVSDIADAHGWALGIEESPSGGARIALRGVELAESEPTESSPNAVAREDERPDPE